MKLRTKILCVREFQLSIPFVTSFSVRLRTKILCVREKWISYLLKISSNEFKSSTRTKSANFFLEVGYSGKWDFFLEVGSGIFSMWDIVKNATKPTRNLVENVVLKDNDRDVNDPATVVSLLTNTFRKLLSITKGFQPQNSTPDVSLKVLDTMFVSETSSYEILKIIGKLKNKYSAGLDEFPDCLLKTCAPAIIHPLTHIFNASLCTGIFPDIFKTAKIKPLFKKATKMKFKIIGQFLFCQFFQKY